MSKKESCFHCGDHCEDNRFAISKDKNFCCSGCKLVYELLNDNELTQYYDYQLEPGSSLKGKSLAQYSFLEDEAIQERIIEYQDENITKVLFQVPSIHCSSCIWLLENLARLNINIVQSRVDFTKREVSVHFYHHKISLRKVAEILASIGYEPNLNLSQLEEEGPPKVSRKLYYQLGVAGFTFGNIMLMSFPEYIGLDSSYFKKWFGIINIILSIPVLVFAAKDYFISAWSGLKQKYLNVDLPISMGITSIFIRSLYEILIKHEGGYLDSFAGLVFFLLIGKWFQQNTYNKLSFDKDYKSYFPISALLKLGKKEVPTALDKLDKGDIVIVKNEELIPSDGILHKGIANIDYSFVTGEAETTKIDIGKKIFAGGRQIGNAIEITLTKKVNNSYLLRLWNNDAFKKTESGQQFLADRFGRIFTIIILGIAFTTLLYWLPKNIEMAITAFSSVLIIACPCAIALSIPFTYGNILRILAKKGFYIKNTNIIELIQEAQMMVFDKTGTLTENKRGKIDFIGILDKEQEKLIASLVYHSSHPKSVQIKRTLGLDELYDVKDFEEIKGQGLKGTVNGVQILVGSELLVTKELKFHKNSSWIVIDEKILGYFEFESKYRKGLKNVIQKMKRNFGLHLISGDNDKEKQFLMNFFSENQLHFNTKPQEKLDFVYNLQKQGQKVIMIGDGLNDAGALKQSDIGIVLTDDTNSFTPACDIIMDADNFAMFPNIFDAIIKSRKLIWWAYGAAIVYNLIGLSFAVQGNLSPLIAAVLMPLSSVSIAIFGVVSSNILFRKL